MTVGVGRAITRGGSITWSLLFRPMRWSNWLPLALALFVIGLDTQAAIWGFNFADFFRPSTARGTPAVPADVFNVHVDGESLDLRDVVATVRSIVRNGAEFIADRQVEFIALLMLGVLLLVSIVLFLTWLGARFRFVVLDSLVRRRVVLRESWIEMADLGNSFFVYRVALGVLTVLAALAGLLVYLVMGGESIETGEWTDQAEAGFRIATFMTFGSVFIALLLDGFVRTMVLPTMYVRRVGFTAATALLLREGMPIARGRFVALALLFIAAEVLATFLGRSCLCCVPVVGDMVALPITLLFFAVPLAFVDQFGDDWRVLPDVPDDELVARRGAPPTSKPE